MRHDAVLKHLRLGDLPGVTAREFVRSAFGRRLGRSGFRIVVCLLIVLGASNEVSGASSQDFVARAEAYRAKGNLRASIIELKNALQKDPRNPDARLSLGQVYI